MVNPLNSCCCGCSLKTGVKIIAALDIFAGVMTILSLISPKDDQVEFYEHFQWKQGGFEYTDSTDIDVPTLRRVMKAFTEITNLDIVLTAGFSVYNRKGKITKMTCIIYHNILAGSHRSLLMPGKMVLLNRLPAISRIFLCIGNIAAIIIFISAVVGLGGISKRKSRFVRQYAFIRALEVVLSITMCIWFLCVLPRIVREFMDAVIEQIKEEAKRRHEDPPEIDEEAIIKIVVSLVTTLLVIAEALGVLVKLYFVWVIKSCAYWMQRGIDPYAPIYVPTAQVPITGTTLQAYQPANVILGPPIAAPASDHPTASLLVTQGPQNPTAPVFSAAQLSGSYQHESNVGGPPNASHPAAQGERSDAYPRL